jgi:hypothetical protein
MKNKIFDFEDPYSSNFLEFDNFLDDKNLSYETFFQGIFEINKID